MGHIYPGSRRVPKVLKNLMKSNRRLTRIDRWSITFRNAEGKVEQKQMSEMLCYFSIGYTAQITLKFQEARSQAPNKLNKPWKNKLQYVMAGGVTVFEEAQVLNTFATLRVDGRVIKLPRVCKSIVVSNLSSMADGVNFWYLFLCIYTCIMGSAASTQKDLQTYSEPSLGDGLLEVMASKGLYKYLQMKLGMSHYRRLAQAREIEITFTKQIPIQVDGEAWMEPPGSIKFTLKNQMVGILGDIEPPRGIYPLF
ncbi:hypothetical protein RFI_18150 [Reticulomyxa filosa]|uniref:Diacylglycerol kinase accessory domain-containing protein n=1 Tax=Reticulomyxa filosa TaxID=46433 RepID=X6MZK7_RETFI|nr:hypothetical protein RFI_18150 [Reticulomyxa filosa]|eukprot:ETO19088.1 hypothetical protein RFI_18150 [Reticulomyxa filosa]